VARKERKKAEIKIVYIKTPGDALERMIEAITPNIRSALSKCGATLTEDIGDILRKHALNNNKK